MSALPSNIDIAIIGAGAAGLGAAHALENSGYSTLILEARARAGGRACTVNLLDGILFDEGCGWLHSANRNSFVALAEDLNFMLDKTAPPWEKPPLNPSLTPQESHDFTKAMEAFDKRLEKLAKAEDVAANAALERDNRWNPALDAVSTYYSGAELAKISVHDLAAYEDTEVNWRVREGYGALVGAYAQDCDISYETKVSRIDHSRRPVQIETNKGTVKARAVIVTVPTPHIAEGRIAFFPDLPDKREAAANLPLGVANKVMLKLADAAGMPQDVMLLGRTSKRDSGSYHLRPFGRPCIEAYFGGEFARGLEKESPDALAAQAVDEIVHVLGETFRARLTPLKASGWAFDPFSLGAYSYAKPGCANARTSLAEPVDHVLFFAGEATSSNAFSTAHGARDSGERAAKEVMRTFK